VVEVSRGDIVIVALPGDYGKPRPAVVVQSRPFLTDFESVIVCPITSDPLRHSIARIVVSATPANGLVHESRIMADKIMTIPKKRIPRVIGRLERPLLDQLDYALAALLGL
jgi:mRNA interferase MazF